MAHYSIFIPGASGRSRELLKSVGLDVLQQRTEWDWYDVPVGPDGPGAIATIVNQGGDGETPILGYMPDKQQWRPRVVNKELELPKGAFWFGFEPDRPPKPTELGHRTLINGYDILLKDKQAWRIPETLQMPLSVGRCEETGELVRTYPTEYLAFCKMAEKYVFIFFEKILMLEVLRTKHTEFSTEEIEEEFVLEDAWEYCAKALEINYRITDRIIGDGFLDLFNERHLAQVIRASLSMPDILEVIEKKKITSPFTIGVGLSTEAGT